jgi:hypothetical protein
MAFWLMNIFILEKIYQLTKLLTITCKILQALSNKSHVSGILWDLAKARDSIHHSILITSGLLWNICEC